MRAFFMSIKFESYSFNITGITSMVMCSPSSTSSSGVIIPARLGIDMAKEISSAPGY